MSHFEVRGRRNAPFVTTRTDRRVITASLANADFDKFDAVCEAFNLAPGTLARLVMADIATKPEAWHPTIRRLLAEQRAKQ